MNLAEKVTVPSLLEAAVKKFYESDLVSRQLPGRTNFITVIIKNGKERVQKKILMTTAMEACLFKNENSTVQSGKSKFANLRPPNVVPVSDKDQIVCCCSYHENFGPECQDVFKAIEDIFDVDSVLDPSSPCSYLRWNAENTKVRAESTLAITKAELTRQLELMRLHIYIATMQLRQIRELKKNLSNQEVVLQEDFSENFRIKQQDEIMSAHWVTNLVTIFIAVMNTNKGVKSFVVISDELKHDKVSVLIFNRAILAEANAKGETITLHFFTDGAGSQFKNRFTLSTLLRPRLIHHSLKNVDWSFFATARGKGQVYGVRRTVKRAVCRRILQKRVFLNTPEEFAAVAKESCPSIIVLYVSSEDIARVLDEIERLWTEELPHTIQATHGAHYFKPVSENELDISTISPFLAEEKVETIEYRKVSIFHGKGSQRQKISKHYIGAPNAASCSSSDFQGSGVENLPDSSHVLLALTSQLQEEHYYAVDYIDKFYIGRVLKPGKRNGLWQMNFLHQSSIDGVPVFNWPATDDCDEVHHSAVFFGPVTLDGFLWNFTAASINPISHAFAQLKKKQG